MCAYNDNTNVQIQYFEHRIDFCLMKPSVWTNFPVLRMSHLDAVLSW